MLTSMVSPGWRKCPASIEPLIMMLSHLNVKIQHVLPMHSRECLMTHLAVISHCIYFVLLVCFLGASATGAYKATALSDLGPVVSLVISISSSITDPVIGRQRISQKTVRSDTRNL